MRFSDMDREERESFVASIAQSAKILLPLPDAAGGNVFRVRAGDGKIYYAYEFEHPSVAASVVLYNRKKQAFLLIERATDPFNGYYAFPGGFIDVGKEEIEDAAVRELFEEAGVQISAKDLQLIDVRSHPNRDPRDHIFDIAYYAETEDAKALVGDEVSAFAWVPAEKLDGLQLAFDHQILWERVKDRFLKKKV